MGGGYFPFFTENRPQKHKKHAILHTSQANGGARAPPAHATAKDPISVFAIIYNNKYQQLKGKARQFGCGCTVFALALDGLDSG